MNTGTLPAEKRIEKSSNTSRIQSLDIVRGAVIVLMAIDHVRVYSGLPAGGTDPGIFFTRWITHFCAPAFVFFAGTSAFLYGDKVKHTKALALFLLTRGLILIILELTVIRLFWSFNLNYQQFTLAGVIWMLGWCMVILSALIFLRPLTVGIIGLVIIFFQQVFAFFPKVVPGSLARPAGYFWEFIYTSGAESWPGITILYVLVPWIGVMAAGYAFGTILLLPKVKRRKVCLWIGVGAILLFLLVGSIEILLRPASAEAPAFIYQLLNQQKYPASQLYLLMTLGPAIAMIPIVEDARGWIARVLKTFGSVPMFYYLLHILLIHISALVVMMIREGKMFSDWYANAPYVWIPEEHRWSLGLLYLVFLVDIIFLYFLCRWYARFKFQHPEIKMLKYL